MAQQPEAQKANYVIGAPWPGKEGQIADYNYWGTVHFGTMEEAVQLLEVIKDRILRTHDRKYDWQPKAEDYQIYQVVPIK
jgi:hypothetical protein